MDVLKDIFEEWTQKLRMSDTIDRWHVNDVTEEQAILGKIVIDLTVDLNMTSYKNDMEHDILGTQMKPVDVLIFKRDIQV